MFASIIDKERMNIGDQKFRKELKAIAVNDPVDFFENYATKILTNSDESNLLIALKGRYQELKKQQIQGIISNDDYLLEFNKIKVAIIDLIDNIDSAHYIPDMDSSEIGPILLQLNVTSLELRELVANKEKQIESLENKLHSLQRELDRLHIKHLERAILSIDSQDANLESYFISEYLKICQKYNDITVKYEVDKIFNAVIKYSEKYPNLIDSEKSMIVEGLAKLNKDLVNQRKFDIIISNFNLGKE